MNNILHCLASNKKLKIKASLFNKLRKYRIFNGDMKLLRLHSLGHIFNRGFGFFIFFVNTAASETFVAPVFHSEFKRFVVPILQFRRFYSAKLKFLGTR